MPPVVLLGPTNKDARTALHRDGRTDAIRSAIRRLFSRVCARDNYNKIDFVRRNVAIGELKSTATVCASSIPLQRIIR